MHLTSALRGATRSGSSTTATITDPSGDVAWTLQQPPAYVDIVTAVLTRSSSAFELRMEFAGTVPTHQTDDTRTMNVASFYDVDGDGTIDYEIWASLADTGWGPGYLDRRNRKARFMADSGVEVRVESQRLVIHFPLTHLHGATSFQWETASEWGSYDQVATGTVAQDHAPNDGAAAFTD